MNAYLTALAGIAGILLGTLGSGVLQWLAERRRERAQARVAGGFIRAEVLRARLTLQAALNTGVWWPPESAPGFEDWEKWGPPLLTGARGPRADRFHAAILEFGALDASAKLTYRPVDEAQQRLVTAREHGDTQAEVTAQADLENAQKGVMLGPEDRVRVVNAIATVERAVGEVPKQRLPPPIRRAMAPAIALALLAAVVLGIVAAVNHYQATTVTTDQVANAVRFARHAETASCSPVKDVEHRFDCELTYASDPARCPLPQATGQLPSAARVIAASRPAMALVRVPVPPCAVALTSTDQVAVDPRKRFIDEFGKLVINETAPKARRAALRLFRSKQPRLIAGKVP